MTNCCLMVLGGIWSFLMGSLRMILFFGCILYIMIQTTWLLVLYNTDKGSGIDLPGVSIRFRDYLNAFALLLLGFLGCYGAFYKHHPSIRTFSLLSALNTLLLTIILLYSMGPDDLREQNNKIMLQLQRYMNDYDWEHSHLDQQHLKATRAWDGIQSMACCGIKGPDDWKNYRPDDKDYKDAYPPTCCVHERTDSPFFNPKEPCRKEDKFFETGCSDRILELEAVIFFAYCIFIIYQMGLSVISYLVGSCSAERSRSYDNTVRVMTSSPQASFLNQPYQQPPMNQDYIGAPKYTLPPMYPNLRDVERNNAYSGPPPSYGT